MAANPSVMVAIAKKGFEDIKLIIYWLSYRRGQEPLEIFRLAWHRNEGVKGVMSLFLSCSCFNFFEIPGKLRLVGKIIDPAAQPTDMTVAAHDQMLSDPA